MDMPADKGCRGHKKRNNGNRKGADYWNQKDKL